MTACDNYDKAATTLGGIRGQNNWELGGKQWILHKDKVAPKKVGAPVVHPTEILHILKKVETAIK